MILSGVRDPFSALPLDGEFLFIVSSSDAEFDNPSPDNRYVGNKPWVHQGSACLGVKFDLP